MNIVTVPTLLTLTRLVISPLVLPFFLVYLLPMQNLCINATLLVLFIFFSITDFFDGYLARRMGQVSTLGKMLDPIADKFLVYSTLIALLAAGKIYFYWVVLLIGRDFFMMGLRAISLEHRITVPVSYLGKTKTVFLMAYLGLLIVNPYQGLGFDAFWWTSSEIALLIITLLLSLYSAQRYYVYFIREFYSLEALPHDV